MKAAPASPDVAWPIILPLIGVPTSAVDFGCGTGHWLAGLKRLVPDIDVLGLNTSARSEAGRCLPDEEFSFADLTASIDLGRKFDLSICMEVVEHLPSSAANTIVESITRHSDVVLFSAAIPGQGGLDHVNEQWPAYWIERFRARDFACFDRIRPLVWQNDGISTWYRQNIMLFMRAPRTPPMTGDDWRGLPIVHPGYWQRPRRLARSRSNLIRFVSGRPVG
jgi:SAM-dependent methyltransferase